MFEYVLRLFVLVPMVGGLAWGSLWLWRRMQLRLPINATVQKSARVIDVLPMGAGSKLAVIEFGDRNILIAVSRTQISLIADQHKGDFDV